MNPKQISMSVKAVSSLIRDLETNSYIPPKFRRAPFTDELRLDYINELCRERARLERMLEPPKPITIVAPK